MKKMEDDQSHDLTSRAVRLQPSRCGAITTKRLLKRTNQNSHRSITRWAKHEPQQYNKMRLAHNPKLINPHTDSSNLVGDGVEEGAERGHNTLSPCDVTVEPVRERRPGKNRRAPDIPSGQRRVKHARKNLAVTAIHHAVHERERARNESRGCARARGVTRLCDGRQAHLYRVASALALHEGKDWAVATSELRILAAQGNRDITGYTRLTSFSLPLFFSPE